MEVTALEPKNRYATQIELDGVYFGTLSKKEVAELALQPGEVLTDERYALLHKRVLLQGQKKALDLLLASARTRKELAGKLRQGGYTETFVAEIIAYVDQFSYLDETSYAISYVRSYLGRKSLRQIRYELTELGIPEECQEAALADYCKEQDEGSAEEAERIALAEQVRKAVRGQNLAEPKTRERLLARFLRKGYGYRQVADALEAVSREEETD